MIAWLVACAAFAGLVLYAWWIEPRRLEVHEVEIPIAGLDPAFDGYRIALVSDIHWGIRRNVRWLRGLVERTNVLGADVILIGGDLIHYRARDIAEGIAILSALRAPDGVWCVLGNHDHLPRNAGPWVIRRELAAHGMRELWNEAVPIHRGDATLWIGGVGDFWRDACDVYGAFRDVPPDQPRVLLSHNPDGHLQRGGVRVDLILSGHTHGGQVRLPLIGPVITRTLSGRALAAGLHRLGETWLYVGRGVSHGRWPLRFLCRPELPVIVLRSGNEAAPRRTL